jgi:hypothetical protein
LHLSLFRSLLLCALLMSIVFACISQSTPKERFLAVIRYFVIFVILSIALAWLMYAFTR